MKLSMEISSIENSNLHIQIKDLNICTTHSKTHGKSRDFSIARIHLLLSRDSKIGPVRVNHKVSTTGDGTRKQGDVEISNFPISFWDGLVIDVSFVCEFKGSSRAPGE